MLKPDKKIYLLFRRIFPELDLDNEQMGRRRLFRVFLGILIVPLIIFGISQIQSGHPEFGIPDLVIAVLLVIFILLSKKIVSSAPMFRIMALVSIGTLSYWVLTGAVEGYASMWVIAYPPFVYFLMGRKEGTVWTIVMTLVTLWAFFNPFPELSFFNYSASFISRHLGALFMVILFTSQFESVREKFRDAMYAEKEKLLEEKKHLDSVILELERTNRLLEKEMEERRLAQDELTRHRASLERMVSTRTEELQCTNEELREAFEQLEKANTDLQHSKDSLSASEERYRILVDNLTDLIWSTDLTPAFTYVSPTVKNMYGYTVEEAMLLPFYKLNTPASHATVMRNIAEQLLIDAGGGADPDRSLIIEIDQVKKDGSVFPAEIKVSFIRDENGKPIGAAGITRDITERREAQREKENMQYQLSQAQKMEAIGTLVGGLAHDFNNLLGGIIGSFELIKSSAANIKGAVFEEISEYIMIGMEASKRSVGLIRQLLAMSRKREPKLESVDISRSLNNIHVICRNSFPKSVNLDFPVTDERLMVMAEPLQIEQVLLNLAINASHAMTIMKQPHEEHGGTLSVKAERVIPDRELLVNHPELCGSEEWIRVQFRDSGVGIHEDISRKIFEPFFSTKEQGQGTGLGLSISYSIIKQHGGFISLESTPGRGSLFSIYLPPASGAAEESPAGDGTTDVKRGTGRVLIIDDEKFITDVVKGILENSGYEVTAVNDPEAGVRIYAESYKSISLVMIDLSMPGRSGIDVFRELKKINSAIKAVLISGMLDDDTKSQAADMGFGGFLYKPFQAPELTSMLKELLG